MQQAIKLHQDLTEMYPHMKKYLHKGTDMLMLTPDQMRREIEDGCRTERRGSLRFIRSLSTS